MKFLAVHICRCTLFSVLISGFVGLSNPDNFEAAERAVGQVMLQLRHLVNVWKDVLPSNVYAKSIGMNPNNLCINSELSIFSEIYALSNSQFRILFRNWRLTR